MAATDDVRAFAGLDRDGCPADRSAVGFKAALAFERFAAALAFECFLSADSFSAFVYRKIE
ncbi:MAG: hypothetical protein ACLPUT_00420 [Solirubrobacteraceae bacterium]